MDGNSSAGDEDIFLTKFDSNGEKQWTKQLGTTDPDWSYAVATDSSNNVYISGSTEGNLDGNNLTGSVDCFLTKFNSSGTKQWTKLSGHNSAVTLCKGVSIDSSNNIYISGWTTGDLNGNTNSGSSDIFLSKYDASGNRTWTKLIGGTSDDQAYGSAIDPSGNIYVYGETGGTIDNTTSIGSTDIFLIKYNSSGSKQWIQQFGSSGVDYGDDISTDNSSNIYLTGETRGSFYGSTAHQYAFNGGGYPFLIKINSSGTKQWSSVLSDMPLPSGQGLSFSSGRGLGVINDSSSNVYITGFTTGNLDDNINSGYHDIFLTKFNSSGTKQWTKLEGSTCCTGNNSEYAYDLTIDTSDYIFITGGSTGTNNQYTSNGDQDIFIYKFSLDGVLH